MTQPERLIDLLRRRSAMSIDALAAALGIQPGSVRSLVATARRLLPRGCQIYTEIWGDGIVTWTSYHWIDPNRQGELPMKARE